MWKDLSVQVGTESQFFLSNYKFMVLSCFCEVTLTSYRCISKAIYWYPVDFM